MPELNCCFCNNKDLSLLYTDQFHKVKKDHGPINFYTCKKCHSGLTFPLPSSKQLENLYSSFVNGMDEVTRNNRDANPLDTWFQQCIDRGIHQLSKEITSKTSFTWIDIGAGKGELASLLSDQYPNSRGLAIDFHSRPELLNTALNVDWLECDLNEPLFSRWIDKNNVDLIFSITVLEHISAPGVFIKNVLPLLNQNGAFYLTVPDFSSIASRLLKSKWPYLLPGEHLNIPSKRGMNILLNNLLHELNLNDKDFIVFVKRIILPYPLRYYLMYFRLNLLSKLFGSSIILKIPTGILEAGIKPGNQKNK
jgi:2-polyprenyl-3-methyl-5-hydroxy-6-metoxy-1,4-benzoquinol methylase